MHYKPCCEDMRRQLEFRCADHADLSDCPDSLVISLENSARFGIRVHDGGSSFALFATAPGAARVCQIVMKANVRAKQSAMLDAEEASLRARLLAILPGAAAGGAQLFLNSTNSPKTPARYSHKEADALFMSAQRCMVLREKLGLDAEGGVAGHFLIACREAASGDAHRRGPRKLAEWLLTKITS